MVIYGNKLVNTIAIVCFSIKLDRHVSHGKRMNPIDFGGQRSMSQWTYMEIRFEHNRD